MTAAPHAPRSVLVVDDDADILEIVAMILAGEGYQVLTAADGAQALDVLRHGSAPSLILLDMMMPTMDGWQFREAQTADPALAMVPVIVLTGDGNAAQKAHAIRADGYLKKPVELPELLEAVRRACERVGEEARRPWRG